MLLERTAPREKLDVRVAWPGALVGATFCGWDTCRGMHGLGGLLEPPRGDVDAARAPRRRRTARVRHGAAPRRPRQPARAGRDRRAADAAHSLRPLRGRAQGLGPVAPRPPRAHGSPPSSRSCSPPRPTTSRSAGRPTTRSTGKSRRAGALGTGARVLAALEPGEHTITARMHDASAEVAVSVAR